MGSNTLLQKTNKMYRDTPKGVTDATFIKDFTLLLTFTNGIKKEVDFGPAFAKYAQGYYSKYATPSEFKKFMIDNDHLVWGKNWDLVFETSKMYEGTITNKP